MTALSARRASSILRAGASVAFRGVDPDVPVACLECGVPLFPDDGYTAVGGGVRGFVCRDCNLREEDEISTGGTGAIWTVGLPVPPREA